MRPNAERGTTDTIEDRIASIGVSLEAFAICEIQDGYSLDCPPVSNVVVHFVLQGEGSIEWAGGKLDLGPGAIVLVPANIPKRISGQPPITRVIPADRSCPLLPGLVKFRACDSPGDLILGCGSLRIAPAGGRNLFDHLLGPLVERCSDEALPLLLQVVLAELSSPSVGSKSIIEGVMRQILVCLARSRTAEEHLLPFWSALVTPELCRSLEAMYREPQKNHSLDDLAKLAGMSRSRFTHRFAAAIGQSPMQFLQAVRLHNAIRLLEGTRQPIKAIAQAVGYASRSHFSRAFRKAYGADPTAFRHSKRSESSPEAEA